MSAGYWTLPAAFDLEQPGQLVAFVGGGGKTSLMLALARALPGRTVVTTTTRLFASQLDLAAAACPANDLGALGEELDHHGHCLVYGAIDGDKALGVEPDLPSQLLARPDVDYVLVEADGSRMRPVKAPAEHEPVIPIKTSLVVVVAGLDALERPLSEVAHRPEHTRELLARGGGARPDDALTPASLARILAHAEGGLKGAPPAARVVVALNKVETPERLAAARETAALLLAEPRIERVLVAAALSEQPVREVRQRVTAVVLAAGLSTRMGQNKLLLPWGETTVLGRVLDNVMASDANDILLVTGHEAERVEPVAAARGVTAIHNHAYQTGMLSSLQRVIPSVPPGSAAVLVMLGDQPLVDAAAINRILEGFARSGASLVAPVFGGRRGNPVLIGREHFEELLSLPQGAAPRDLLGRYSEDIHCVEMDSDAILHDLDYPEQYAAAQQ